MAVSRAWSFPSHIQAQSLTHCDICSSITTHHTAKIKFVQKASYRKCAALLRGHRGQRHHVGEVGGRTDACARHCLVRAGGSCWVSLKLWLNWCAAGHHIVTHIGAFADHLHNITCCYSQPNMWHIYVACTSHLFRKPNIHHTYRVHGV